MSDQVSGDAGQTLAAAPCSAIEVPYSDMPHERPGKVKLVDGDVARFKDGRRLEAYRSPDGPGIWFRIASPLAYGKESMLKFRLSDEAACALAELITRKFSPNKY